MARIKETDINVILATFRLMDGQIYRISKNGKYWKPVEVKLNKLGRGAVKMQGSRRSIVLARLLFILNHSRDIRSGYLIDHIDNNPWNNSIDNLQELNNRDNVTKEKRYNPNKGVRFERIKFEVNNSKGKLVSFSIGTYHDDAERKAVWNTLAPLFLFRQELKGTQVARERLLDLVDSGEIVAARAWVKAYALAHGIEIKH